MKTFLLGLVAAFALNIAMARAGEIPAADQQAIRSVIEQQLDAFARDDNAAAFSFASPLIQNMFGGPEAFGDMVRRGYAPVHRNTARRFTESFADKSGAPAQQVQLTGADGKRYVATYTMERQADGTWKISGCYLNPLKETGV
jgi:hypothetical protein